MRPGKELVSLRSAPIRAPLRPHYLEDSSHTELTFSLIFLAHFGLSEKALLSFLHLLPVHNPIPSIGTLLQALQGEDGKKLLDV